MGAVRPGSCPGTAIGCRLRAGKTQLGLTGRPAICRPVPRRAVRKRGPSPNPLRREANRPSRIPRRPPHRTGLRRTAPHRTAQGRMALDRTALDRTALDRPLPRPTALRPRLLCQRVRLPAGCRTGPPGSLAGDRARRPAALPPGPAHYRRQPPRLPGSEPSPSPHASSPSRRTRRSRRVRRSRQVGRPPVSQLRRSPPVKRQGQSRPAKRRSPNLPAWLLSHSRPPGRPDRTGRLVLVRRTRSRRSRQGTRSSRSGARWCPRS
jgi:hypothetical protein